MLHLGGRCQSKPHWAVVTFKQTCSSAGAQAPLSTLLENLLHLFLTSTVGESQRCRGCYFLLRSRLGTPLPAWGQQQSQENTGSLQGPPSPPADPAFTSPVPSSCPRGACARKNPLFSGCNWYVQLESTPKLFQGRGKKVFDFLSKILKQVSENVSAG